MQYKGVYVPVYLYGEITEEYDGCALKDFLRVHYKMSSTFIKRLKYAGGLYVNDMRSNACQTLTKGDLICADLYIPDRKHSVVPAKADIDILYEDEHLICLNKPAGICTHPVRFYADCTLANHLMHYYVTMGMDLKIRPVSRLDIGTSGLVTFAKNEYAQERMTKNILIKEYAAIAHGRFDDKNGIIDAPIIKKDAMERMIDENGRSAVTLYEVIGMSKEFSYLKLVLLTGRTHQIRVHLSHIGHPLLGDSMYSGYNDIAITSGQALHSRRLAFHHPVYDHMTDITAPLPLEFRNALIKCDLA
jgi:23S rRNA pseudouridine1911/1915/1917 synthase